MTNTTVEVSDAFCNFAVYATISMFLITGLGCTLLFIKWTYVNLVWEDK